LAQRAEGKITASNYEASAAFREAFFGSVVEARRRVSAASKLLSSTGRPDTGIPLIEATIEVLLGDTIRGEELANQLAKRYPEDTLVQNNLVPAIHAQIAINRGNPTYAIELLERAKPYEFAFGDKLASAFVRGNAYLDARHPVEAASEFQRILDHRGLAGSAPWGALARVGLARAYALQGDKGKAQAAYDNFFTLWKDADPDVPILKQAKAEYAKLK
jgi:predicted Zn-dependent protease